MARSDTKQHLINHRQYHCHALLLGIHSPLAWATALCLKNQPHEHRGAPGDRWSSESE